MEWEPISKSVLQARIDQGLARMTPAQQRFWNAIRIDPQKWKQHPYGDQGGGFWVVAVIGRTVVWYNDIEDGFNRSNYSARGVIDEYWCNNDELELAVHFLLSSIESGHDMLKLPIDARGKVRGKRKK
jgi:hypothetical protein